MLFFRYFLKLLIDLSEMLFEPPKRGLSNLVTWRLVGFIRADADRLVILQGAPEQAFKGLFNDRREFAGVLRPAYARAKGTFTLLLVSA